MRQIQQNYRSGELDVVDVPLPSLRDGGVRVANAWSLISAGTERTTVSTARKSLLGKARSRPDLVAQVLRVARREGLLETWRMVRNRLDTPLALGYSCAGYVVAAEGDVGPVRVGDRVACAGAGYASHAEVVFAPKHLVAPVPEGVGLDEAAYATLGAIALQGVRQARVSLGDSVAVVGLGLLGQLTVQILKAAGCRVLGVDLDPHLVALAARCGADQALERGAGVERAAEGFTSGWGVARVIRTASTRSSDPIELAGAICREKGTVVVVGNMRLDVPREAFYRKELDLRLSRSYGPGRYDARYEEAGVDYPLPYVRWTEQRNLSAFLDLVAAKRIDVAPLTTHRFPLERAAEAYRLVTGEDRERSIGILLRYEDPSERPDLPASAPEGAGVAPAAGRVGVSFVGAGSFARNFLLPRVKETSFADLRAVVTATGLSATDAGRKFGFAASATDAKEALEDPGTRAVFIATRHDSHAALAAAALRAGKYVFVEKPLALDHAQLAAVRAAVAATGGGRLMVGFNRRWAPAAAAAREALEGRSGPMTLTYRVNAGTLPRDHWLLDPSQGGGRLLGEGCHFVDFACFLTGERVRRARASATRGGDNLVATLEMSGGSVATIQYVADGPRSLAKEWIEAFADGRGVQVDDFATATLHDGRGRRRLRLPGRGRGHREEVEAFLEAARDGRPLPVQEEEAFHVTEACFALAASLVSGEGEIPGTPVEGNGHAIHPQ